MKKILTAAACLLWVTYAPAQMPEEIAWKHLEKVYNTDSSSLTLLLNKKPLEGFYKIPFDDGSYSVMHIKKGLIGGEVYWYTASGRKEALLHYRNGVRHGLKENYDQDGNVWMSQQYRDGRQDGEEIMYSKGVVHHSCSYRKGLKQGPDITYNDGAKLSEDNYEAGLKNGVSRVYDLQGKLQVEAYYKDGQREGFHHTYTDGRKTMSVSYYKGIRHGVSYMYKPDGSVLFESWYFNNNKVSKEAFEKMEAEGKAGH